MTINVTGDKVAGGSQELFILHKIDGNWKSARYVYFITNPRRERPVPNVSDG